MTHEEIFRRAEAKGADGAYQRISENHPVGLYLGVEKGQRSLMVVCPTHPPDPPSLAVIGIDIQQRTSGDWALVLRLERADLKALFAHLVEDLEEATRTGGDDPGEAVIQRLARWQRLLSRRTSSLLDENQLRGLAAELSFLIDEAAPSLGVRAAIAGWVGPFAAPRDFVFGGAEVEVKSARRLQRSVLISSLEQLTDAGRLVFLWLREIEPGDPSDSRAFSLPSLVAKVRLLAAGDPVASDRLEECLRSVGYEDRVEYDGFRIRIGNATLYRVAGAFPRLQRDAVSAGIVSCRYEVATTALQAFVASKWQEDGSSAARD